MSRRLCALALACLAGTHASAQEFAASVSPPRFELSAKPGTTLRQTIELIHSSSRPGAYRIASADWQMDDQGAVSFYDALQPGSCRPWLALERPSVQLMPGARLRYRFEIQVPAQAEPGECRLAILIGAQVPSDSQPVQLGGRLALIVYVRVGDAEPRMRVEQAADGLVVDTERRPALRVSNDGQATGRLDGTLVAIDAAGRRVELRPESVPVLPGRSRVVALSPLPLGGEPAGLGRAPSPPPLRWPMRVEGKVFFDAQAPMSVSYVYPP